VAFSVALFLTFEKRETRHPWSPKAHRGSHEFSFPIPREEQEFKTYEILGAPSATKDDG